MKELLLVFWNTMWKEIKYMKNLIFPLDEHDETDTNSESQYEQKGKYKCITITSYF